MDNAIFLANDWTGIHRASPTGGGWMVQDLLADDTVHCLAVDPHQAGRVYAGTRENGVLRSDDAGQTWESIGPAGVPVKSLAVSPHRPGVLYAGAKPVSLYVTRNGGEHWEELPALRQARKWWWFSPAEPPGITPYVQAVSISPDNPEVLLAGIELGALLRSTDGGKSWSGHLRRAIRDCHSLTFHRTNGSWVYEGGAGGPGAAISRDGGKTWQRPAYPDRLYGWMVAADSQRPEVWYLSAGGQPNPLRGEFVPQAHVDGEARAHIYRSTGGAPLERLSGGLPEPLDYMAYALVPHPQQTGRLFAGLANGDIWETKDYGDRWERLPFNLKGIHRDMVIVFP